MNRYCIPYGAHIAPDLGYGIRYAIHLVVGSLLLHGVTDMSEDEVAQALRELIRGVGVRRASHGLNYEGKDVSALFIAVLESEGYVSTAVEDVAIEVGERVPAFSVAEGVAHFGWVFWEVFAPGRRRKLFGSHAKDGKGDWAVMLGRRASVYACPSRKELMDTDRPSSL